MSNVFMNTVLRQKSDIYQDVSRSLVHRFASSELIQRINEPLVKVITGPRRCGKSTLARQSIAGRSFAYLNFEDEGLPIDISGDQIMDALHKVYGKTDIIFFDEIQNMPRWQQFVHRLHREGVNCIVTGSNAHLLSSELASALTGRHLAIELLPFSYAEYLASGISDSDEAFDTYLKDGGFPQVALKQVESGAYLSTLWDAIVLKDVVRRHKVRNVAALNNVYGLLVNAATSKFNYESLTRSHGEDVSPPTVKKFIHYASEAYLLVELAQFHFSTRQRIKSSRKVYIYDNGFITARRVPILGDAGKLLENLVFLELLRRGARPNIDLFYYVTKAGHEVDFLIRGRQGADQELIQVSWIMSEQKTREREIRALESAATELGCRRVKIITHRQREIVSEGSLQIDVVPVREWLLEK